MLGSTLANIGAMLGPTSKSCWAKTKVNMALGCHLGSRYRPCWCPHWPISGPCWGQYQNQVGKGMLGPTSKSCWAKTKVGQESQVGRAMLGPTSKSCWAKTKVGQDKDHVGVHIGQHQGHVGTGFKVMLAKTKVNMALGSHLGSR